MDKSSPRASNTKIRTLPERIKKSHQANLVIQHLALGNVSKLAHKLLNDTSRV